MHLQGVPLNLIYSYETDRCWLDLRVGIETFHLYADSAVAQRLFRQVRTDTSGITVTLSPHNPQEITHFSIIL